MNDHYRMKVFLCHASQDKQPARELYERLAGEGYDVWLDERSLLPGQDWEQEIQSAVKNSDAVVVLISNNSVSKVGFIQRELRLALDAADERPEGAIFLIPLRLDDAPTPLRLRRWHCLDIRHDDWFDRLLVSLNSITLYSRPSGTPAPISQGRSTPVIVDFLSLESSQTAAAPGQVIGLEYRIRLWPDQALNVALGASLVSKDGAEFFDVTRDRNVALVPGEAVYRRQLQVPETTPSGIYRLIGGIWTPRIGDRRLATLDRGFIISISAER